MSGNLQKLVEANICKSTIYSRYPSIVSFCGHLFCHFRDRYLDLVVPLHLMGDDSCKVFISKISGMNRHECAYDFHELVGTTNPLNHISDVEHRKDGLAFKKKHNKMVNI